MRTSYRLSQNGMSVVDQKRQMMGWNKISDQWVQSAHASQSTLKRFLKGKAISVDCFVSLCKAVGIEDWQSLVDWQDDDSTRVAFFPPEDAPKQPNPIPNKHALVVTGVFTEDQQLQIEALLEALKNLLLDGQVVIKRRSSD